MKARSTRPASSVARVVRTMAIVLPRSMGNPEKRSRGLQYQATIQESSVWVKLTENSFAVKALLVSDIYIMCLAVSITAIQFCGAGLA